MVAEDGTWSGNYGTDIGMLELLVCCADYDESRGLADRLRKAGFHRVIEAMSGADALKIVSEHSPRLLVTSLSMSDMKYWAFVRTLRNGSTYPRQIPVLALASEKSVTPVDQAAARDLSIWLLSDHGGLDLRTTVIRAINETPKLRLLVIEDDPEFAELLAARLIGYDVHLAATGAAGVVAIQDHRYDMVILDLRLPDTSGEDVLEIIYSLNPRQLVLVATGDAGRNVNLLQRGADQYLVKPLTVQAVQQACDNLWTHTSGLRMAMAAEDLKEHLFLANECMLAGRTGTAHTHIQQGLNLEGNQAGKTC